MGFRHGEGNERLLECTNCNEPMELDAVFCVECGTKRTEALRQKVSNKAQEEILVPGVQLESLNTVETGETSEPPPAPLKVKKPRDPKVRLAISRSMEKFGATLRKRAKVIYTVTALTLITAGYSVIQTMIFATSTPEKFGEKYIQAVIDRDESLVSKDSELFLNPENLPILPRQFQEWIEIDGLSWKTFSEWNGWSGEGYINFVPMDGNSIKDEFQFTLPIRAIYSMKFGVFREARWVAAEEMATVSLAMNSEKNIGISINEVPAGSIEKPVLQEKKYVAFPGPFKAVLSGAGFTKLREKSLFLGASQNNVVDFPTVEYSLSPSHVNSAVSQLRASLEQCLRRECSDLPNISRFDFSFDNEPVDYLYTDYFYVDWDTDPDCSLSSSSAKSAENGSVTMNCTVYAYGSIKWILYRIWLTTYYDTGFDSTSVSLTVSADVSRTSNPYAVKVSKVRIN
jgi:hypothetical protein